MRVLNEIKQNNANIVLADGQTTLSMASSGLSYKEMNGLLGNSVREIKVARIENVVGRSHGMFEAPMVAPPDFCARLLSGGETVDKDGFTSKRAQAAFSSIGDALLHMLGFARNSDQKRSTPLKARAETQRIVPPSGISSSDILALNDSEDTSGDDLLTQPAVFKSPAKPLSASASIVSSNFPSKLFDKPNDASKHIGSVRNDSLKWHGSTSNVGVLDFSSDDDSLCSIPGPVFKK
jgi:hypothetical protein